MDGGRAQDKDKAALVSIAEDVSACRLCPLADSRTNAVPGEGPGSARIIMVGEAPGKDEDRTGRPFVGRAGKVLMSALEAAGARREDFYITNVVKCRPPKNRVPRKSETKTCMNAHLKRELEEIRPDVVVLLGRTASASLQGAETLKEVRGSAVERDGVVYVSTYHPAAILRNPKLAKTFRRDIRAALSARRSNGR